MCLRNFSHIKHKLDLIHNTIKTTYNESNIEIQQV